jgi:hypothetical protein
MHLANGDIPVERSRLPDDPSAVDRTVEKMVEMAKGQYGARSAKIRALAINIVNNAKVADKDYFGMIEAIHNWVRDTIRYVKDPVSQETLSYPEETAFNSLAGDCDDKTILEMALLGSIGLRSYPVVIGMQAPGHYSHVYLNAMVPPGKGRHAGETIPADPIMREWPLGKEAPAYKVKAKKLYSDLSGLTMLDGYADADDYLDTQNLASVVPVLRGRSTDSAGGPPINTKQVLARGESVDDLFGPGASLKGRQNPTSIFRAAGKQALFARGPMTAYGAENSTSYLHAAPVQPMRAGSKVLTVRVPKPAGTTTKIGPTVGEMLGLADYLAALEPKVLHANRYATVTGANDPMYRAAAAAHYAHARAAKARHNLYTINRHVAMAGLSGDVPAEAVLLAQKTAILADALAAKAKLLAQRAAGASPARINGLHGTYALLGEMDKTIALTDIVTAQPAKPGETWFEDTARKVETVAQSMFDGVIRRAARPAMPIKQNGKPTIQNPLTAGSIVRDHNGDMVQDQEALAGFFSNLTSKLKKSVPGKIVNKVVDLHKRAVTDYVKLHKDAINLVKRSPLNKAITGGSKGKATKKKTASGAIVYQDENGNVITQDQYNAQMGIVPAGNGLMTAGGQPAIAGMPSVKKKHNKLIYSDAAGNTVTKAVYDQLLAQANGQLPPPVIAPSPAIPGTPIIAQPPGVNTPQSMGLTPSTTYPGYYADAQGNLYNSAGTMVGTAAQYPNASPAGSTSGMIGATAGSSMPMASAGDAGSSMPMPTSSPLTQSSDPSETYGPGDIISTDDGTNVVPGDGGDMSTPADSSGDATSSGDDSGVMTDENGNPVDANGNPIDTSSQGPVDANGNPIAAPAPAPAPSKALPIMGALAAAWYLFAHK